jgi:peptidyl-prolyl cis-trans isomerase D
MFATLRKLANTLVFKVLFGLLMASFSLWGIGDVVRNIGRDGAAASVAGVKLEMPQLQEAFQRNLRQAQRSMGLNDATPELRRTVAIQTLGQLLTQAALTEQARTMGLATPQSELQRTVEDIPAFQGPNGKYDKSVAEQVLRNNGLSEQGFAEMLHTQLLQQQLLSAVGAGAAAPSGMAKAVYTFQHETRTADAVTFPFAAGAAPPEPSDAQLRRWYENHPAGYSTPEYRRIKAAVLSPETVAKDMTVSEDDLKGAWEQIKAQFNSPEKRSAQVILTQDKATADKLAAEWSQGEDWAAMQKSAAAVNGAAVELDDATRTEFPAPELAAAVFAAAEGVVPPPVRSALGWHVLKVVKIDPAHQETFAEARDLLVQRVKLQKANDIIYDRANKVDNELSAGGTLDNLSGDIGAAGVTGTLDAAGRTPDGRDAPIPGSPTLRQALIASAFAAHKGDVPKLEQAPAAPDGSQGFFAVSVEDILPPKPRPFEAVTQQVRADWMVDQKQRAQNEAATRLMLAVQHGTPIADAAKDAGLTVTQLPPVSRVAPAAGVPPELVGPLFSLKQGQATMVTTADSYVVAQLAKITEPDPKADPAGFAQLKAGLDRAEAQDTQDIYANAVRDRDNPHVGPKTLDTLASAGNE